MSRYHTPISLEDFKTKYHDGAMREFMDIDDMTKEEAIDEVEGKSYDEAIAFYAQAGGLIGSKTKKDIYGKLPDLYLENFEINPRHLGVHCSPVHHLMGFHMIDDMPYLGFIGGGDGQNPVFAIVYWDGEFRGYVPEVGNSFDPKTKELDCNADPKPFDAEAMVAKIRNRIKPRP